MTRPHDLWVVWLAMPAYFPLPMISQNICQMILDGGDGLFKPATIKMFASPASPSGMVNVRGLGWDIDSQYSGNRGNLFPAGTSFGHTGFTGTSIWIDPGTGTYVILLANSGHPHLRAAITPLRRTVATIVAKSVGYGTRSGLDVLVADNFRRISREKGGPDHKSDRN